MQQVGWSDNDAVEEVRAGQVHDVQARRVPVALEAEPEDVKTLQC